MLAILADTKSHVMPPSKYVWIHSEAKLSDADVEHLEKWAVAETRIRAQNGKGSSR